MGPQLRTLHGAKFVFPMHSPIMMALPHQRKSLHYNALGTWLYAHIVEHMENNFEGIAASDVVVKSCVEKSINVRVI